MGAICRVDSICIHVIPIFVGRHLKEHNHGEAKVGESDVAPLIHIYDIPTNHVSEEKDSKYRKNE